MTCPPKASSGSFLLQRGFAQSALCASTFALAVACGGGDSAENSGGRSANGGATQTGAGGKTGQSGSSALGGAANGGAANGGNTSTPGAGGAPAGTGGALGIGMGGTSAGGSTIAGGRSATGEGGANNGSGAGGIAGTSSGGASSGGASAKGGAAALGGTVGMGGAPMNGGTGTGGTGTGGTGTGGTGTGGTGTGGTGTGGTGTGGTGTGGTGTGGTTGDCNTPPAPSPLIGWATNGSGTTGGGNATPVVVTTATALSSNLSGTTARVIHLAANVSGSFSIGSNKTLIGVCGARIQGHLGLGGSSNVIVRNLKIVGNNCSDSPQDCSAGADAITVNSAANHLWFDHLDVSDGSDGNLDITQGSDFVTVSWTKFSYSSKRSDPAAGATGHRFSNLIGASDTDTADPGHLNVTYHHCWWADNVDQRMPRTRRGQIHVLNNLFTASGNSYCSNAGQDAKLLVENNVYIGVNRPLDVTANGNLRSVGNVFTNTTGTSTASGSGFTPSYTYQADATSGLESAIRSGAGATLSVGFDSDRSICRKDLAEACVFVIDAAQPRINPAWL